MTAASRTIDYLFTMRSPWAYIGHGAFIDICRRRQAAVRFRPMSLATLFPESGGLPLEKRHPSRQAYRLVELRRWRERRGLRFELQPRCWPFDATLADRVVVVLAASEADPEPFVAAGFRAVWEEGRDLADVDEIGRLLASAGHDAEAVLGAALSDAAGDAYAADTRRTIHEGVFGSPTYRLDGENFWGQDRLDLLDDALASGRAPFGA